MASFSELGYVELTPDPGEIIGGHRLGPIVLGRVAIRPSKIHAMIDILASLVSGHDRVRLRE